MKGLMLFLASLGVLFSSLAQSKASVSCEDHLNLFYHLAAKEKDYIAAYPDWKLVYENCPELSKNTFIYGTRIVKAKIERAESTKEKEALVKLLIQVYDKRLEYFPVKQNYVLGMKAIHMAQYKYGTGMEAYGIFEKVLQEEGKEQSAAFYNALLTVSIRLFQTEKFSKNEAFEAYSLMVEGIEHNNHLLQKQIKLLYPKRVEGIIGTKEEKQLKKLEGKLRNYEVVEANSERFIDKIADCKWLAELYNSQSFNANRRDTLWLKRAASMLLKKRLTSENKREDCTSNVVFYSIAEALHRIEPSSQSARALAQISLRKGENAQGIQHYEEAAKAEINPKKRSADYLQIARIYYNQRDIISAKQSALKAASLNTSWGEPFLLLAKIYVLADGKCGKNVFEQKAVYWAAIDKLQRAKEIDLNVKQEADDLIQKYKEHLPNIVASFGVGYEEGDSYLIECGIDEKIVVNFYK